MSHSDAQEQALERACREDDDALVRKALGEACATVGACLAMNGASPGKGTLKPRRAAARGATTIDPGAVLTYVRNNAGSSGEQIAEEMATDTATLRPVLRGLIESGEVKASGKARGTRYAAG